MIVKAFTQHPSSVGESYFEHMGMALSFSGPLMIAMLCCFVHAIFPFAFEKTGSKIINRLHERMVTHRVKPEKMDRVVAEPAE